MFTEYITHYDIKILSGYKYVLYRYSNSTRFGKLNKDGCKDIWSSNMGFLSGFIDIEKFSNYTFLKEFLTKEEARNQYPEFFL